MTQVAEITVAYNNPPKEGKKWGNIKGSDGSIFFAPPAVLSQFRTGETCRLEWEPFGDDGSGKKIKRKIESPTSAVPKQNTRPSTSSRDSEQIFVTAALKEFIGAGLVANDVDAMVETIKKLRKVYAATFGGVQAQTRDDLDDNIPF